MKVTINETLYWYEIFGEGEPILLLHGFTGSTKTWSRLVDRLKESNQVIVIDLPGHGQTISEMPKTMENCCEDLAEFLGYLQLDKVHLLGYSMGGRTALSFTIMFPQFVHSLILESASPGLANEEERKERMKEDEKLAQRIERDGIEAFVSFWENIPLFETQKQLPASIQQQIRKERLAQSETGLSQSLRYMGTGSQPNWWNQLSKVNVKVLLIVGEYDSKFVNINQMMDKQLSNSHIVMVKQAGHAIHVEQNEIFGKIVKEFISTPLE